MALIKNHTTSPIIGTYRLSLVSVGQLGHVRPIFDSSEPQEFEYDIDVRNGTRQRALWPILRHEFLTLVSVVQSESVIPFWTSAEPQEFKSDIGAHNETRQWALRHVLRFQMVISFEGGFKMKNVFSKMFLKWPKYGVYKFSAKIFFWRKINFSEGYRPLIFSILTNFSIFLKICILHNRAILGTF